MGGPHKLLARFDGVPLVRRMAQVALASRAGDVMVVTGHRAEAIEAALAGLPLSLLRNMDHAHGMGGSLALGVRHVLALSRNSVAAGRTGGACAETAAPEGLLVMLADMPGITPADLDRLIACFEAADGEAIVRATCDRRPGNPVILPRSLFPSLETLSGDEGARRIIAATALPIFEVELGAAARLDVDTPEALAAAGGVAGD